MFSFCSRNSGGKSWVYTSNYNLWNLVAIERTGASAILWSQGKHQRNLNTNSSWSGEAVVASSFVQVGAYAFFHVLPVAYPACTHCRDDAQRTAWLMKFRYSNKNRAIMKHDVKKIRRRHGGAARHGGNPVGRSISLGMGWRSPPSTWFPFLVPHYFPILVNLYT